MNLDKFMNDCFTLYKLVYNAWHYLQIQLSTSNLTSFTLKTSAELTKELKQILNIYKELLE